MALSKEAGLSRSRVNVNEKVRGTWSAVATLYAVTRPAGRNAVL